MAVKSSGKAGRRRRPARGPRRASRRRQQDRFGPVTLPAGGLDEAPAAGRPDPGARMDEVEEDELGP